MNPNNCYHPVNEENYSNLLPPVWDGGFKHWSKELRIHGLMHLDNNAAIIIIDSIQNFNLTFSYRRSWWTHWSWHAPDTEKTSSYTSMNRKNKLTHQLKWFKNSINSQNFNKLNPELEKKKTCYRRLSGSKNTRSREREAAIIRRTQQCRSRERFDHYLSYKFNTLVKITKHAETTNWIFDSQSLTLPWIYDQTNFNEWRGNYFVSTLISSSCFNRGRKLPRQKVAEPVNSEKWYDENCNLKAQPYFTSSFYIKFTTKHSFFTSAEKENN